MDALLAKFRQYNEREQKLIIAGAILCVVIIVYYGMWTPLSNSVAAEQIVVEKRQAELNWVSRNADTAIQLRNNGQGSTSFSGSLPQTVNYSAQRLNIAISRMQPQGEELQVWVDEAPFNDVVSLLQSLEKQGITILNLDLQRGDASGYVRVRKLKLGKS